MASQCPFLAAPFEIRKMVFEYLLVSVVQPVDLSRKKLSGSSSNSMFHPSILATCKQVHAEATPILYDWNIFSLYFRSPWQCLISSLIGNQTA